MRIIRGSLLVALPSAHGVACSPGDSSPNGAALAKPPRYWSGTTARRKAAAEARDTLVAGFADA
jgi:hypothetical protein